MIAISLLCFELRATLLHLQISLLGINTASDSCLTCVKLNWVELKTDECMTLRKFERTESLCHRVGEEKKKALQLQCTNMRRMLETRILQKLR